MCTALTYVLVNFTVGLVLRNCNLFTNIYFAVNFSMAATQRVLPQNKEALLKSYQKHLKDDVRAMVDNYVEIIKLAKVSYRNKF